MMKFKIIIILILCFSKIYAQSVTLTPSGVLVPSMTSTARTALTATDGQLVYDTTTSSFWYYNGSTWKEISTGIATNSWTISGNNIYNNNTSNVGIGTANPINKLDIAGAVVIGSGFAGAVPVPANGAIIQGQVGVGSGPSNTESNLTIGPNSVTEGGQIQLNPGTGFSKAYHIDNWSDNFRIMSGSNYGSESPRFFINSVGKIGIGTTSPVSKLDVEGGLSVGENYSGTTASPSNGAIIEGNVGIGTNSPTEKLEVSGKTKTTNLQITNGAANGYILKSDANGNATWEANTPATDNLGNHLATTNLQMGNNYINNDGGSEGLSINTNGAVTIQPSVSTDPSLTISTSNTPAFRISQIANGIYPTYQWDMGGNETLFFLKDVSAGSKLPFRVYAGQNTDRLVLRNNNVGIGVNNPSEALEVSGKTKTTTFQMTNEATSGYVLQSDANGNASWVNPTSLPNGNWTTNGNNQYSALNGNVGVGTINPSEKLEIKGNLKINNGRIHVADSSFTVSLGYNTGINNTGNYNLFVGSLAGESNTTGFYNAFVGAFAGHKNTTGFYNSSLGFGSLENTTTGTSNTAIGHYSSNKNTTGNFNVSLGRRSLENNSTNDFNTAIGYSSLRFSDGGEENTGLGAFSLNANTLGDYNVGIGVFTLGQNTEGSENTAIGYEAGYGNITGDGNVFLGRKAGYFETGSNKLYIANSETPLIYGDFINKNVGIGTSTLPTESNLVIAGNTNGEGGQIQLNASTGQSTAYFLDNYINAFRIMSGTNEGSSAVRFFINSSGNIGIGTITPSGKLDVTGSGVINSNVRSTDNVASITVESPNQNDASLFFNRYDGTNSLKRWALIKANSNEAGSNAGGDFVLNRYSDAGTYIGQPILVYRNSGAVVIGNEGTSTTENTFRVNGSIAVKRTVYNANATIAGNDHLIGVTSTSSVTLTLPSASGIAGREYIIKSEAASASITVTTTASQKIDGANSKLITTGYGVLRVYSDGANWFTF